MTIVFEAIKLIFFNIYQFSGFVNLAFVEILGKSILTCGTKIQNDFINKIVINSF